MIKQPPAVPGGRNRTDEQVVAPRLSPGAKLGAYEILSHIDSGGMGEVYKARDLRLGRVIAIKVLPAQLASDEHAKERFEREARTIASLQHPHICTLHDVGSADGTTFIVMEYLEGETLAQALHARVLPLETALRIAVTLADALDRAHRHNVIHRDLKPSNIMLTKGGPKLLDFGLAKFLQRPGVKDVDPDNTPTRHTRENSIIGTLHYLSPEQVEGHDVDHRSDIFAFGCVLYEMVTGAKAFTGSSNAGVMASILQSEVAPASASRATVPPLLDWILARSLEKKPDDRTQSMADLRQNLEFVLESLHKRQDTRPAEGTRRPRALLFGSIAATAALCAALFSAYRPSSESPSVRFRVALPPNTAFWPGSGLAVSPDGRRIAFTAGDLTESLWIRALDASDPQRIPNTEGATHPFWSPDSTRVGFFAEGALKTFDFSDAPPRTLTAVVKGSGGAWNRDDVILFSSATSLLQRISANGGTPAPVTAGAGASAIYREPQFLADGRRFLYAATTPDGQTSLYVGSLRGDVHRRLTAPARARLAGRYLVFERGGALFGQPFDDNSLALTGTPTRLVPVVGGGIPRFAATGDLLVYQRGNAGQISRLVWVDRTGRELGTVGEPAVYSNPALSPDGRLIAVAIARESGRDIWILDGDRGTARRLTTDPADDLNPTWSPDGESIVFSSSRRGERDIFRRSLVGGESDEQLVMRSGPENVESWSHDGKHLIFNTNDGARQDLWIARDPDWKPEPLLAAQYNEREGVISPDGRWLAFAADESGQYEVYVTTFPKISRRWQISNAGGLQPQWRGDGTELYYLQGDSLMRVTITPSDRDFVASRPAELFTRSWGATIGRNRYTAAASGGRFLVNTPVAAQGDEFDVVMRWPAALR